jgi:SAM-dependent methyltransferase
LFERYLDAIDNYSSVEGTYLDVPFVPSEDDVVDAMLELANVGPKDVLYDLGCGDGRIPVAAAREWGTRGVGIDIDPMRIAEAMESAKWSQVEGFVEFIEDDIFTADFSEATAVTLYLLQSINEELRPRLLRELRPGARVVSHAFDMGEWKPDDSRKVGSVNIYKWVVPAEIAGIWEWERAGQKYRIDIEQSYQEVSGEAWIDGKRVRLTHAELRGRRLSVEIQASVSARRERFSIEFEKGRIRSLTAG